METFFHSVSRNVVLTNFNADYENITYSLDILCDIPELLSLFFAGGYFPREGEGSVGLQRRHDAAYGLFGRAAAAGRLSG